MGTAEQTALGQIVLGGDREIRIAGKGKGVQQYPNYLVPEFRVGLSAQNITGTGVELPR